MSTAYGSERASQRERREILNDIRERLGDRMFGDFLVDMIAGCGWTVPAYDLPALADVWLLKTRLAA